MGFWRRFCHSVAASAAGTVTVLAILGSIAAATEKTATPQSPPPKRSAASDSAAARTSPTRTYTVGRGDTLYSIARRHSLSVQSLEAANNLRTTRLSIGQVLVLTPGARPRSRTRASTVPAKPAPEWPRENPANPFALARIRLETSASDIVEAQHSAPIDSAASLEGPGPEAPADSAKRFQLISTGFGYLGVRYRWNGTSEKTGFDCSGLVTKLFDQLGIALPRSAREQYKKGVEVAAGELEPGDLVFFGGRSRIPTHVGIYIGERCLLHAQSGRRRVIVSNLDHDWYKRRFLGARRIPELWMDSAAVLSQLEESGTR